MSDHTGDSSEVDDDAFLDAVESVDGSNGFDSNSNSNSNPNPYLLHQAVFNRATVDEVSLLIASGEDVAGKDVHGNTPLHLAVMLGQKELINLLLQHNAPVKSRNMQGWTPLDEAISYGDRKMIKSILRAGRKQARESIDRRRPKLVETLQKIPDFRMELRWEFYSWLPLVKRFLPSDTCRLAKKGCSIRLDTTLLDFSERHWQRGDITFLFAGDRKPPQALVILDNELKAFQYIRYHESVSNINDDLDMLMSSDIIRPHLRTKSIAFNRTQTGWFFSRYNKTEKVGQFEADCYNITGLAIETKKRREHLSEEDVQSNKALYETFKKSLELKNGSGQCSTKGSSTSTSGSSGEEEGEVAGEEEVVEEEEKGGGAGGSALTANSNTISNSNSNSSNHRHHSHQRKEPAEDDYEDDGDSDEVMDPLRLEAGTGLTQRRRSLPPPPVSGVTWRQYVEAPRGEPPCLARPVKSKTGLRQFKASIAMSQDFPLTVESLLNVLEVVAPFKHFRKLKEFINLNLPPGFPVKIDIPIIPTVLARVTFANFEYNNTMADSCFEIPTDYTEDPDRFPDL